MTGSRFGLAYIELRLNKFCIGMFGQKPIILLLICPAFWGQIILWLAFVFAGFDYAGNKADDCGQEDYGFCNHENGHCAVC